MGLNLPLGMVMKVLLALWVSTLVAITPARAHETQPAIMDVTIGTETLELTIDWMVEAAVAEIERLMHEHGGPHRLEEMLSADIRKALHVDNVPEAKRLFALLRGFLAAHPEAVRGSG